jgi:hypothetical protein
MILSSPANFIEPWPCFLIPEDGRKIQLLLIMIDPRRDSLWMGVYEFAKYNGDLIT